VLQRDLYELARNAGRDAGRLDVVSATRLRDTVIDAAEPAQVAGWLDGLAETRTDLVEWPLPQMDAKRGVAGLEVAL
jgi:hypothetical protein